MNKKRLFVDRLKQNAVLKPPVSKSDAIRVLMLQFARNDSLDILSGSLPDDVLKVKTALDVFNSAEKEIAITAGLGGAPLRFLASLAAMVPGHIVTLDAEEPLRQRPHEKLFSSLKDSLTPFGLKFDCEQWPLQIDTRDLHLPEHIDFSLQPESSQYLTGLALAGANAISKGYCDTISINLDYPPLSGGYAALTANWLEKAGFQLNTSAKEWHLSGYSKLPFPGDVPLDWSSAAYLALWAWKSNSKVIVSPPKKQPDSIVIDILSEAGLGVAIDSNSLMSIEGELKAGLKADAKVCPDLIPTLAVLALIAPEVSIFERVRILESKESNRLKFIEELVTSAGGSCVLKDDTLFVKPVREKRNPILIKSEHDHRRAMAGSVLIALGWSDLIIDDTDCVGKSFPDYWCEVEKCGLKMVEVA